MTDETTHAGNVEQWVPQRIYTPGNADPFLLSQRAAEKREREKREANRPTGTEIEQIKRKQQEMIAQLQEQQQMILRVTPTVTSEERSIQGVSLGDGWATLMDIPVRRDTSYGKSRALVLVAVSSSRSGETLALLEVDIGGRRVGAFPGVTLPSQPFGGTASALITSDTQVTLKGVSAISGVPSPIGDTTMTVTVISIA